MSAINFKCPHCDQALDAQVDMGGEQIRCPSCNRSIRVPGGRSGSAIESAKVTAALASGFTRLEQCLEYQSDQLRDIRNGMVVLVVWLLLTVFFSIGWGIWKSRPARMNHNGPQRAQRIVLPPRL